MEGEHGEQGRRKDEGTVGDESIEIDLEEDQNSSILAEDFNQEDIVNAMRIGIYEDSKEESNESDSGGDESSDESDELDVSDGSHNASDEFDEEEVIATVFEMFDHEDDEDISIIDYYDKLFNSD